MSTLVVCIDRSGALTTDRDAPVVGRSAVESLLLEAGLVDPEDSRVNCLLEGLRVADEIAADGGDPLVAVLSGVDDQVGTDRAVADQMDELTATHDPDSAVVVVDSAQDERLLPIVESRLPIDAVDRVVVRQARDIESTYYLLKQFLADEELRRTVLVPIGAALVVFPVLMLIFDRMTIALGAIAGVVGAFLLYKGLNLDDQVTRLSSAFQEALYAGQVALVTYVVAGGLALIGVFVGLLAVSATPTDRAVVTAMAFVYSAVPWAGAAVLAASVGRIVDEAIQGEGVGAALVNLPFVAVAVGVVLRGVSAYFLERAGVFGPLELPGIELWGIGAETITFLPRVRLALFLIAGVVVSLIGVRVGSYVTGEIEPASTDQPRDSEQAS
ncbi:MAG: DUF373 family protein [Halococcoides sp.]